MKRAALRLLIGSIAVSAVLGVRAILASDFGEIEMDVLRTALTVSWVSIVAMACEAAWERKSLARAAPAGMVAAIATGLLTLVGIWGEGHGDEYWKTTATVAVVAFVCVHASVVSLAVVDRRFAWVRLAAYMLAMVWGGTLTFMIWDVLEIDFTVGFLGAVSILLAAATIVMPALHRLSGLPASGATADARFCPHCGHAVDDPEFCEGCGARFRVEVVPCHGS
ncbi:MAG: hypothetical protein ACYTGZ_15150 [Planctomycetota bacterium]|jgi:hypothetical protein